MHTDPFVFSLLVYILPSIIAACRDTQNFRWIFIVNVFFGWTVIGWFIALIWAIIEDKQ